MFELGAYNSTRTRVKQDGNVPRVLGGILLFHTYIRFLIKEWKDGKALNTAASNPAFREGSQCVALKAARRPTLCVRLL